MKFLHMLEKRTESWFLIGISLVFFFLRIPSLFEPYWYGDEGIYQTMAIAMNQGALLYRDIWDNKPPLLYVIYALFNGDQFALRTLSLIAGIISVILFFLLAKKLFNSNKLSYIATTLYTILYGLPLLEGNIANAENFMSVPILLSALLVFTYQGISNSRILLLAGILSSCAFLIKVVGIFDFAAFGAFLLVLNLKSIKSSVATIIKLIPFVVGFTVPILITGIYFYTQNAFVPFYQGAFTNMVGYVGYGNQFIIPQGLLIIKLLALALSLLLLLKTRKDIGAGMLFIIVWLLFSVFNAFFAQRPYIHYLLVLLPSFCLFATAVYGLINQKSPRPFLQRKELLICASLLVAVIFLIFTTFKLYDKTFRYYNNFISYISGSKTINEYNQFFDWNTPRDYELVQFINKNLKEKDTIFIWGNNAQVYKMTNKLPPGRFTVAYHMTATKQTLAETEKDLEAHNPKIIIVTSPNTPYPYSLSNYTHRLTIKETLIYERIN